MKFMLNIVMIMIITLTFSWPATVGAWSRQGQYKSDDRHKRHYKKYKHHRNYRHRNTPSREDYRHRLRHRFDFNRHSHRKHIYKNSHRKYYYKNSHRKYIYKNSIRRFPHGHSRQSYLYDSNDNHYTSAQGWDLIKKDRFHEAKDLFGDVAARYPDRGEPKIGVAIASAQSQQMFDGVRAMRRALLYEPDALSRVQVDSRLHSRLKRLVNDYQSSFHGLSRADSSFMVASLYYMMGNRDHCRRELEKNRAENDRAPSTMNLYRLAEYRY